MRYPFSLLFCCLAAGLGCTPGATPQPLADPTHHADSQLWARSVVDSADRSADDRALDIGRKPLEMLQFFGVMPGMHVAELAASGGYTTELLARAVAPSGVVYGQNSVGILEKFAQKPWTERLQKPVMKDVVRLDRDFDTPFPAELHDLDLVVIVLFYHDAVWLKVNRTAMNAAVFKALKPGGAYVVVDHSAKPGTGVRDSETLHRIEESAVREEVQKAGFEFKVSGDFLRNGQDTRDWSASPRVAGERRGKSDRFAIKFVKP